MAASSSSSAAPAAAVSGKLCCPRVWHIIAAEAMEPMARAMVAQHPESFVYHHTLWEKFPDGTDKIKVGGFEGGKNLLACQHVVFLASFHNNDVTLSQFYAMVMLCESFVKSLTVVLPFYPTGTMERVVVEGEIATASTMARLFSSLPSPGRPIRVMIYDIHTLQNRFYIANHAVCNLQTAVPMVFAPMRDNGITAVAFPDDGACKRFGHLFHNEFGGDVHIIICGKIRDGDKRTVTIQDGDPAGKNVLIVDDLVQTGGTLRECAEALKKRNAATVSAFVVHAIFPRNAHTKFTRQAGQEPVFHRFYVTNSNPAVTNLLPRDDVFEVLDLTSRIAADIQDK